MENIMQISDASEFTRYDEVLGVYYTSISREDGTPLARITMKGSDDVYEMSHAAAKVIDLLAFPVETRKPAASSEE